MTGRMENFKLMIPKRDDVIVTENFANRDIGKAGAKVKPHYAALLVKVLYHLLIIGMSLGIQSENMMYESSSKHMVKVSVCAEMMYWFQLLLLDIILDSSLLGIIKGATINDDTFGSLVTHHVAVFLQRIHLEYFDCKHGYNGK